MGIPPRGIDPNLIGRTVRTIDPTVLQVERDKLDADLVQTRTVLAERESALQNLEVERKTLASRATLAETNLSRLQADLVQTRNLVTEKDRQLQAIAAERDNEIKTLRSQLELRGGASDGQVKALETQLGSLNQAVVQREARLKEIEPQLESLRARNSELEAARRQLEERHARELALKTQEAEAAAAQLRILQPSGLRPGTAAGAAAGGAATGPAAGAVNLADPRIVTQLMDSKEQILQLKDREIADLRSRLTAPPVRAPIAAAPISLAAVATNMATELGTAQARMAESGTTPFALSGVSVRLKAMTEPDGRRVRILGPEDLADRNLTDALDEYRFDLASPPPPPPEPTALIPVPDLAGLTSTAASQVLASIGLRLVPATGPAPAGSRAAPGQAFQQQFPPGHQLERGRDVLVVFAT